MARKGKDFEETVFRFYRTLDPQAVVRFDHRVPDRHIRDLRQVDAWVELRVLGNIPLRILISCKDHRRRLGIGAIEQCAQEVLSTGATNGVLYSRGGFTPRALKKARELNINCCRLFDDQPPELPTEQLLEVYVAVPEHRVLAEVPANRPEHLPWDAVLRSPQSIAGQACTVADFIAAVCFMMLQRSEGEAPTTPTNPGPKDLTTTCDIASTSEFPSFRLHLAMTWRWFRAAVDVLRLTGSFNATEPSFVGTAKIGPVPMDGTLPAERWEECSPPTTPDERGRFVLSMLAAPTGQHVRQVMGSAFFGPGSWTFGPPSGAGIFVPGSSPPIGAPAMQVTTNFSTKPTRT